MRMIFIWCHNTITATRQVISPKATVLMVAFAVLPFAAPASAAQDTAPEVRLFTHGDTPLLLPDSEGVLKGPAMDLFQCSMNRMQRAFSVTQAPLSRARRILSDMDNAIWFPIAHRGGPERMARAIGPAGTLDIYWYKSRKSTLNPNSDTFKRSATVTTYKGSAMADQLRREGYNFIEGSADRNRLVFMLLNGQVDAFAAIDFRGQLPADMLQKLSAQAEISIKNKIPAAFQISDKFHTSDPAFAGAFRTAFGHCLSAANSTK